MSEHIVSAEAREQSEALDRLVNDYNFGYFNMRYPKLCQQFIGQVQFNINRTERTARLAYIEEKVKEVLANGTTGQEA